MEMLKEIQVGSSEAFTFFLFFHLSPRTTSSAEGGE